MTQRRKYGYNNFFTTYRSVHNFTPPPPPVSDPENLSLESFRPKYFSLYESLGIQFFEVLLIYKNKIIILIQFYNNFF